MPRQNRPTTVYPIALRELEVLRVADVTPGLRRVTLTGEQLAAHRTPDGFEQREFVSAGFDDDIRLLFPYPGETEPVLPTLKDGGLTFPKERKVLAKVYTVRSYDPETRELEVDFVKHGVGVATTWAYRTTPGDRIHVAGPSNSLGLPEGADWLLVLGDDTAAPAIARLLDELPEDARGEVFIEIAEADHAQKLRELPGVRVTWLSRDGAEPGSTNLLLDALRGVEWRDGEVFAWLAGEQATVRDLRRHLIEERGVEKTRIDFTGYWKRSEVVALEEDPAVPDPERNEEAFEKFHEQAELLPPLAIRIAANLGIAELISRGVTGVAELAERTGTQQRALAKFLRYLEAIEILEQVADGETGYRLSETGEFLTNEYVLDVLRTDGVTARREQAFLGLEESLRTGQASFAGVTGQDYASLRRDEAFEHKLLENTAQYAAYLAAPLAAAQSLAAARRIVVHSNGAGAIAAELTARLPEAAVVLVALPTQAGWLRGDLPRTVADEARRQRIEVLEQSVFEPGPQADTVLLVRTLVEHPDAEAAHILRRAAAGLDSGGRVLLVEDTFDTEELDEHDAEADLLHLALHGSGHRTDAELDQVIQSAGLQVAATETIGWGTVIRTLTPTGTGS